MYTSYTAVHCHTAELPLCAASTAQGGVSAQPLQLHTPLLAKLQAALLSLICCKAGVLYMPAKQQQCITHGCLLEA